MSVPAGCFSSHEWLTAVREAERRGELLEAFDIAERALAEHPGDVALEHRAVLALARAGSTEEAARRFVAYGLTEIDDEDVAALRARIAKDIALAANGEAGRERARRSAELYAAIFDRTGGHYPGVNAATMSLLAGDAVAARRLARKALESAAGDSYYEAASRAEALLLLGDEDGAATALEQAAALHDGDYGALAATRRQLGILCRAIGVAADVLDVLAGPSVVHFCGHRIDAGRFPAEAEPEVARAIADALAARPVGYAYGALSSGADIMWAEALLERGAELHVVLPFAREEFRRVSVEPAGRGWAERFERCMAAATTVRYATEDAFLGDDVLYRYGAEFAMGLALLRARYLRAEVRQLAVWDGRPASGPAGTAVDLETWRGQGYAATVVTPPPDEAPLPPTDSPRERSGRIVCALLFGDFKGFSQLIDEQFPRYTDHVLSTLADVLDRHGDAVLHRNTWGDAIYVALDDLGTAAECALQMQTATAALDLGAAGLPANLMLRLSGHVGPVFNRHDPLLGRSNVLGTHVTRTARVEPVTPPGAVYVTDAFAAALVLAGRDEYACDYVGHMPAAKDYGRLRMYRLRRRSVVAAA